MKKEWRKSPDCPSQTDDRSTFVPGPLHLQNCLLLHVMGNITYSFKNGMRTFRYSVYFTFSKGKIDNVLCPHKIYVSILNEVSVCPYLHQNQKLSLLIYVQKRFGKPILTEPGFEFSFVEFSLHLKQDYSTSSKNIIWNLCKCTNFPNFT